MKPLWVMSVVMLTPFGDLECHHPGAPSRDASGLIATFSFELPTDTVGWSGHGGYGVALDAPPGGGTRSFEVSGGCMVPHASRSIVATRAATSLRLEVWGKNLAIGGSVVLRRAGVSGLGEMHISVQETVWTRHHATGPLSVMPGDTLELELMSGGIVYSAMRVDEIEVRMIDVNDFPVNPAIHPPPE